MIYFKYLLLIIFAVTGKFSFCQEAITPEQNHKPDKRYERNTKTVFKGDLRFHLLTKTKYPKVAYDNKIEGRVLVKIYTDKRGRIDSLTIIKGVIPELDKEALRLARSTNRKWISGKENGKAVSSSVLLVIDFNISDYDQRGFMKKGIRID